MKNKQTRGAGRCVEVTSAGRTQRAFPQERAIPFPLPARPRNAENAATTPAARRPEPPTPFPKKPEGNCHAGSRQDSAKVRETIARFKQVVDDYTPTLIGIEPPIDSFGDASEEGLAKRDNAADPSSATSTSAGSRRKIRQFSRDVHLTSQAEYEQIGRTLRLLRWRIVAQGATGTEVGDWRPPGGDTGGWVTSAAVASFPPAVD